jgi:hypothetical protein
LNFDRSSISSWCFLFFALIYSAQVLPRLGGDSLTNDEPVEITNGYYYLTQGDAVTPHLHPPLAAALNALPLLFWDLKTAAFTGDVLDRAHSFLFEWNLAHLEAVTRACRSVSWLFGFLTGFLLFWITRKEPGWCFGVLFFWALDPTFLALAGIAKIEIIPDFFFLMAVWFFSESFQRKKIGFYFLTGFVSALAVAAKYDALVLIPLFILFEFFSKAEDRPRRWAWGFLGFVGGVLLVYLPFFVLSPQRMNFFGLLYEKFIENFVFAQHPYPVYLLGQAGLENHWYYLPIAFALKEPVPFLFFLALALLGILLRKIRLPLWQWLPLLVLGPALLFVTNLGVRYLLPLYPFFFLIAARGLIWLTDQTKGRREYQILLGAMLLWQAISLAVSFSHPIKRSIIWRTRTWIGDRILKDWRRPPGREIGAK